MLVTCSVAGSGDAAASLAKFFG